MIQAQRVRQVFSLQKMQKNSYIETATIQYSLLNNKILYRNGAEMRYADERLNE